MPGRSTVTEVTQIGVEGVGTPGTVVPANRKLSSLSLRLGIEAEIETFRPQGSKYPTVQSLNKEWSALAIEGQPTYDELAYLFASAFTNPVVAQVMDGATPTGAYRYTFTPSSTADDAPRTFTVEQGSSVRAMRSSYGLVSEVGLSISRDDVSVSGSGMAQILSDGIAMTAAPTALPLVPLLPGQFSVYMDATSAALGTTKLTRLLSVEPRIGDRFNPLWVVDAANPSWATHIEGEPSASIGMVLEANTQGMNEFLPRMRDGVKRFVRIEAVGPNIYVGGITVTRRFRWDMCVTVGESGDFSDEDGVYAKSWTLTAMQDDAWGKSQQVEITNTLAAL